jgi:hypothetical protein
MPNDSTKIVPGSGNNLTASSRRTVPEIPPALSGALGLGGPLRLPETQSPKGSVIPAFNLALNPWPYPDQLGSAVAGFSDRDSLLQLNTPQLSKALGIPLRETRRTLQGLACTVGIADWNDDMPLSKITDGLAKKPASEVSKSVLKQIEKMPPTQRIALLGTLAGSLALTNPQLAMQLVNGVGFRLDVLKFPNGEIDFYLVPGKGDATLSVNAKLGDVSLAAITSAEKNYKNLITSFSAALVKGAFNAGASLTTGRGGADMDAKLYAGLKINQNFNFKAELHGGNGSQQAVVKFEGIF